MFLPLRAAGLGLAMSLASAVAHAQAAPAPQSVQVTGKRGAAGDAREITAAKSKVLSRRLASSCHYMSACSAAEDDVTQAYTSDMGLEDSMSNEAERFHEYSPNGDASTDPITRADASEPDPNMPTSAAAIGCGPNDRNFGAGRNHIARKGKSLGEAFAAFDKKDYARAAEQATVAWNKIGYEEAALMLARLHLYGLGTPKSPQLAVKWYAKAAEIGFVPAGNTLGMAALYGFGMPKSAVKSASCFKEAAEAGYAPAQFQLASLYYLGDAGVPQDLELAGAWFAAAAKSGHAGALYAAGRMVDLGEGIAAGQQKAIVYYKEAALKSHADAQSALATYFYTGEVVKKDLPTARKLFAQAARQGQPDAMFNLGVMTARAEAGVKDMATAYVWLSLAKDAGHPGAAGALAQIGPGSSPADRGRVDTVLKPKTSQ